MVVKSNNSFQKVIGKAVITEYLTNYKQIDTMVFNLNGKFPNKDFYVNAKLSMSLFVLSGSANININGIENKIKKNDLVLINHGEKYRIEGKELKAVLTISPSINYGSQLEIKRLFDKKNKKQINNE